MSERPEYDDDANIGDDTMGCPGIMNYLTELESYADALEAKVRRLRALLRKAGGCLQVAHMEKRLRGEIVAALEDTK